MGRFAISLLEAMYMKKICIVSNCIGNRDVIINGKNGYIAKGVMEFEKNITKVIEQGNNNSSIVKEAYSDVVNSYNIKSMIEKYINLYKG